MAGRSIVNQGLYLQLETTPGVAATTAMKRYLGIRGNIGWDTQKESFTASGYKFPTAEVVNTEAGTIDLTVIQEYNSFMPLLAGVFGKPTTTEVVPGEVYQHVFSIDATAADELASYTMIWGDAVQALQAVYSAFHGLTIGIQKTQLSLSATGILNAPTSATIPATGVTTVPMTPLRAATYCGYIDDSWADLGTTKALNLYSADIQFGDKYTPDWIIDCAVPGHSGLMEAVGVNHTLSMQMGFDAAGAAEVTNAKNGKLRFVRMEATGPEILDNLGVTTGENYKMTIDLSAVLNPRATGEASVSPATVVNFDGTLMVDPDTENVAQVTLINNQATL